MREIVVWDDIKAGMMLAAIKAVRQCGPKGVRIQNISELTGISLIFSPVT